MDYKTPEPGEVVYKLCMIAKERNIDYTPSQDSQALLLNYCNMKGIAPPISIVDAPPAYVPVPQAFTNPDMVPGQQ